MLSRLFSRSRPAPAAPAPVPAPAQEAASIENPRVKATANPRADPVHRQPLGPVSNQAMDRPVCYPYLFIFLSCISSFLFTSFFDVCV